MIGIVDYGMGNLFSVSKALERLNVDSFISDNPAELEKADGILLPGVGSFKDAMHLLHSLKLADFLHSYVESGRPLLGICLGMQLLFQESEENGLTEGLSLLPGQVVRLPEAGDDGTMYKVPHMGWNRLQFVNTSPILTGTEEDFVYFVHSYYVATENRDVILASANYGVEVPAVVGKGNVFGMQFHPEKSSDMGMSLLKNFIELAEGKIS
ncbi:imidazole glycerol phosphate synthase subunit HisH [Peribacillus saganii]|uniref:Imidazole glycerol phosphate synthase subunit HisH n=1 Tax=Peribacillus saganii TaxID=2303992 RepID=A0A372LLB1_9BACI|nr:imidazole glycerol phosphate synthase subunit HisH [Peribacillus saganii]RFU66984.1 imidazole glycerol phosphate synthase subunit HisH [Peribacillus saganii]